MPIVDPNSQLLIAYLLLLTCKQIETLCFSKFNTVINTCALSYSVSCDLGGHVDLLLSPSHLFLNTMAARQIKKAYTDPQKGRCHVFDSHMIFWSP